MKQYSSFTFDKLSYFYNKLLGTFAKKSHNHIKSDVGLGNVDNTADKDKPISSAMQTALNGKTSASVLPNDSGEIKTKYRCAQKGYTGSQATWYYKLCNLPINNARNYASAIVSGRIGGWVSGNMSYINALIWNRDTPGISLIDVAGSGAASSIWGVCNLVLYVNSDNTATLYVKCSGYYTFDLDIELYQSTASISYDGSYSTAKPSGTLSASASTSDKRIELYQGKLYASGKELASTNTASASSNGLMSSGDKSKLDGISSGANKTIVDSSLSATSTNPVQNKIVNEAISSLKDKVGSDSVSAQITSGTNGFIKGLSISGRTITYTKGDNTTGTITTQDTNTTYSNMKGSSTSAAGSAGLVPAPTAGASNRYLRSDGTWSVPPDTNTTYADVTTSSHGLMTAGDKAKLDGIASGANKTVIDSALSSTSTNPVQNKVVNSALASKATRSIYTVTLWTNWTGSGPYTQTVSVSGVLSSDNPHIFPQYSSTSSTAISQKEDWNKIDNAVSNNGSITFTCFENKPSNSLSLIIEVIR